MPAGEITIKQDVGTYSPVYNKLEVSCESTNKNATDFKYIFEIVTTLHGTFTYYVTPEPTLSHGSLEFSRVLQGFIIEKINAYGSTAPFTQGLDEMIIEYHIEYGEQFLDGGVITDYKDLTTGTTKYTWDASFIEHEWITQRNESFPFYTWVMNTAGGSNNEFLTNYKTPKVGITDLGWTYLMTDTVSDVDYLEVKTYDSAGALIQTVTANDGSSTLVPGRIKAVATSPQSLNNIAVLASGAQPVITSSVDYYTVQIFEGTPTAISELLTFTIEDCTRYEKYRLHFLNELGGFDSFNFTLRNQKSSRAKRKSYTRAETVITSTGIDYSHENIGSLDYYVRSGDKIKLRSDYLTDAENTWLKELIESPNVLWETTDTLGVTVFYPVKVMSNNWTGKKQSIDKLFNLEIDVELALENTRQRR